LASQSVVKVDFGFKANNAGNRFRPNNWQSFTNTLGVGKHHRCCRGYPDSLTRIIVKVYHAQLNTTGFR
jgi:hypothetical protein